jgi:molybdopterin/thiamine biosynthesis adenylyltransferase
MLDQKELERYARHIVLREVGGPGQAKLKAARVLVIGAGGLGAPVLLYLAAAGVGTLGVIDDDKVALSNLQRQVIFSTADIGKAKAERAGAAIARLNPHVSVQTHDLRLTAQNALDLIARYDLIADGSDNFATRYLVSDACYFAKRPLVTAAVGTFDGSLTTLRPHETRADGRHNPTYRCLFPEPPPAGSVRGGRHSRRAAGRARLADGVGNNPRNRRLRRRPGRPALDGRCALDAVRDVEL